MKKRISALLMALIIATAVPTRSWALACYASNATFEANRVIIALDTSIASLEIAITIALEAGFVTMAGLLGQILGILGAASQQDGLTAKAQGAATAKGAEEMARATRQGIELQEKLRIAQSYDPESILPISAASSLFMFTGHSRNAGSRMYSQQLATEKIAMAAPKLISSDGSQAITKWRVQTFFKHFCNPDQYPAFKENTKGFRCVEQDNPKANNLDTNPIVLSMPVLPTPLDQGASMTFLFNLFRPITHDPIDLTGLAKNSTIQENFLLYRSDQTRKAWAASIGTRYMLQKWPATGELEFLKAISSDIFVQKQEGKISREQLIRAMAVDRYQHVEFWREYVQGSMINVLQQNGTMAAVNNFLLYEILDTLKRISITNAATMVILTEMNPQSREAKQKRKTWNIN